MSVAGIPAFEYSHFDPESGTESLITTWLYKDLQYYFSVNGKEQVPFDSGAKQLYKKILSTFKFIQ